MGASVLTDDNTPLPSSRWYKTDFQIASPLGGFKLPGADFLPPEGRATAAAGYVALIKQAGIEVFAVTDHNSTSMLGEVRTARLWRHTIGELVRRLLPRRRPRANPRVVKPKYTRLHVKRAHHRHWPQPVRLPDQAAIT